MIFAAVDLGSNSFRMHIGRHDGESIRILKSARDPIRLAAGLDANGNLTDEAIQRSLESLRKFREILNTYPVEALRVVATNTIRIAKNSANFLPMAEAAIGWPIDIISGEEEGRLIYMGVANTVVKPGERRLVIDIGGGSTEIILGMGHEILNVDSFSVGTVKHSQLFFPNGEITQAGFDQATLAARSIFEGAAESFQPKLWRMAYGSSGTMRAISDAIKHHSQTTDIGLKEMLALKQHCIEVGNIDQLDLLGVKAERMPMLVAGLAILIGIFDEFNLETMKPVDAGLRMGVMWDLFLRSTRRDRREQAVQYLLKQFHVDALRANQVADMANSLFLQLKPNNPDWARLLYWSALLHEIGMAVSHTAYHKHGSYIVENADIAGFTARELRLMSKFILSQKGGLKKFNEQFSDMDFAKAVLSLRLAVTFMHSRVAICYDDVKLKMKNRIELELQQDWVDLHPTVVYWLQKETECWKDVGIEFVVRAHLKN